ncbi:MAG: ZIP family metal transporter [Halodesulfurarchaeum sp.]
MREGASPSPGLRRHRTATAASAVTAVAFLGAVTLGISVGRTTLTAVAAFGFAAMTGGVAISHYVEFDVPERQVWAYGLASGAMLASAGGLLAPKAIGAHATYGGFAIALGYLLGYGAHELGHLVSHLELPLNAAAGELSLHALAAGTIMGVVYGSLSELTPLLGFGILAHKFPAGFTGSESVKQSGLPVYVMVIPASMVAIAAIPFSIAMPPLSPVLQAVLFGVSTGVFAHVGIDMLPECSHQGSHADSSGHVSVQCSRDVHRIKRHAVASTFLGTGTIFVLWQLVAMA